MRYSRVLELTPKCDAAKINVITNTCVWQVLHEKGLFNIVLYSKEASVSPERQKSYIVETLLLMCDSLK